MSSHILFLVSGSIRSASPRYRAVHLSEALLPGDGTRISVVSVNGFAPVPIHRGDIVVLHRIGFSGAGERFLQAARAVGAVTVWSTDDLIFTPDFAHQIGLHFPDDPIRYRQHRAAVEDFRRMLCACDAALVSTEYLAQQVHFALAASSVSSKEAAMGTPPVFVVRNFLSDAQLTQAAEAVCSIARLPGSLAVTEAEPVTLAYLSGSASHDIDLGSIATPLAAVFSRFPQVRLLLVGPVTLPPALIPFADGGRILRHSFVPWQDLPGLLTHCRVDINLAPLDTSRPFIHAKSEVKFLEAAAVGIPTVASSAAGFAEGVRDGKDCLLASTSDDWERLLADLIQKPEYRRRIGATAADALRARGTVTANAEAVQSVFQSIARLAPEPTQESAGRDMVRWVRPTLRERLVQTAKKGELSLMKLAVRLSRHLQRLREDAGGG